MMMKELKQPPRMMKVLYLTCWEVMKKNLNLLHLQEVLLDSKIEREYQDLTDLLPGKLFFHFFFIDKNSSSFLSKPTTSALPPKPAASNDAYTPSFEPSADSGPRRRRSSTFSLSSSDEMRKSAETPTEVIILYRIYPYPKIFQKIGNSKISF